MNVKEKIAAAVKRGEAEKAQRTNELKQKSIKIKDDESRIAKCRIMAAMWVERILPGQIERAIADGLSWVCLGDDEYDTCWKAEACENAGLCVTKKYLSPVWGESSKPCHEYFVDLDQFRTI